MTDIDGELFIGAQGDVLESYMAKRGGRKDVDPYMLKEHAYRSKLLIEGTEPGERNNVGLSPLMTLRPFLMCICSN